MTNSKLKLFIILAITTLIIFTPGYASNIKEYFTEGNFKDLQNIGTLSSTIITTLKWIGYFLAICVTLATAIQFFTATSQKRAQLKEKLWLIVLGIAILAGGIPLLNVLLNLIETLARDNLISNLN